jgi:hypothetical protein
MLGESRVFLVAYMNCIDECGKIEIPTFVYRDGRSLLQKGEIVTTQITILVLI